MMFAQRIDAKSPFFQLPQRVREEWGWGGFEEEGEGGKDRKGGGGGGWWSRHL